MIADGRGAFAQPALFENFGLTCVEAMASGLPTFATRNGGTSELIKHGINGFHLDPFHGEAAAATIAAFFEESAEAKAKAEEAKSFSSSSSRNDGDGVDNASDKQPIPDEDPWRRISEAGLERVASRYNWPTYSARLATLTSVYAFWKRTGKSLLLSSPEKASYLDLLHKLLLRPLIARVPRERDGEEGEGEKQKRQHHHHRHGKQQHHNRRRGGTGSVEEEGGCEAACGVALGVVPLEVKGGGGRK